MISPGVTVRDRLQALAKIREASESPKLDAQLLLMFACQRTRAWLIAHAEDVLSVGEERKIAALLNDFKNDVPMAYITQQQEFWSLPLKVDRSTLIPRPATESLVEWVLQTLPVEPSLSLLDLGTGSGALALAIKSERNNWQITATDKSAGALNTATNNAEQLKLTVEFLPGSWWQPVSDRCFDCIVSNPPYIAEDDLHLVRLQHEPITALTSGKFGLDDLSEIIQGVYDHLNVGGWFVVEHGYDQQDAVVDLFRTAGLSAVKGHKDLAGQNRFVVGKRRK